MKRIFIYLLFLVVSSLAFSHEYVLNDIHDNKYTFISKNYNNKIEITLQEDQAEIVEILNSKKIIKYRFPIDNFKSLKGKLAGLKVVLLKKEHIYQVSISSP